VKIHSPEEPTQRMTTDMKKCYGVNAHLVLVPESASPIDRLDRAALTAARMLTNFFFAGMTIGLAWGSTTVSVGKNIAPQ
jgi:deoxyribonucleoside regulator